MGLMKGKMSVKSGDVVYGVITNIIGYGAFVSVADYDGLIHISEFSDQFVRDINEFVHIGQEVKLKVIDIDEENKRVKLSYKQIHKTRGVRCRLPKYEIGFTSVREKLPMWIKNTQKEVNK